MANKYPLVLDGATIQELQSGDILVGDGTLPDQTGQSGKFLTTDGSSPSWGTVDTSAAGNDTELQYNNSGARAGASGLVTDGSNLTIKTQGDIRFGDADDSNYVALQGPATVASNVTWTLPAADGSNGQVLSTNGSGTLSWATASGGGGGSNSPYFSSNNGTNSYSIAHNSTIELTVFTEEVDPDNVFSNGRFQPTVAGYYVFIASLYISTNDKRISLSHGIRKNNTGGTSEFARTQDMIGGTMTVWRIPSVVTGVGYLNGTTDFASVFVNSYNYTDGSNLDIFNLRFAAFRISP